jgi:polyisoprenoid-binding protein YceI
MKTIYTLLLTLIAVSMFAQATPRVVDYAASSVTFKIKNAGLTVDGRFKEYGVALQFDPNNLASAYTECKIKTNSISTGINGRDNHLRKEEFFYVSKYTDINFKSTAIKKQGAGYVIVGKLSIKDVTKDVLIPLVVSRVGALEVFEGKLTINRLDYHVGEDSWVMSDDVIITIKIATK